MCKIKTLIKRISDQKDHKMSIIDNKNLQNDNELKLDRANKKENKKQLNSVFSNYTVTTTEIFQINVNKSTNEAEKSGNIADSSFNKDKYNENNEIYNLDNIIYDKDSHSKKKENLTAKTSKLFMTDNDLNYDSNTNTNVIQLSDKKLKSQANFKIIHRQSMPSMHSMHSMLKSKKFINIEDDNIMPILKSKKDSIYESQMQKLIKYYNHIIKTL